ncbi:MAG TPA: DUF2244 domain-containing protein [Burkholderiales bacterium]|jgi:uncharacterized membrane protein|nr:DUF2244 domain-containing protein [Burkholderiales bacterium]
MYGGESEEGGAFRWFSRRTSSLSATGRLLVFASLALVTLAISLGFALRGAWPVLPFAGLECVGLWLAYRWLKRHEGDYECVMVDCDKVVVEIRDGGALDNREFVRPWAQVVVERGRDGRPAIFLRSHGRAVQIGKWLTDEARVQTAQRLRRQISEGRTRIQD